MTMASRKRIVMIAHDNRKRDMLEWARHNYAVLRHHELHATGTTGGIIADDDVPALRDIGVAGIFGQVRPPKRLPALSRRM